MQEGRAGINHEFSMAFGYALFVVWLKLIHQAQVLFCPSISLSLSRFCRCGHELAPGVAVKSGALDIDRTVLWEGL